MVTDARDGRTFSNIVTEFDEEHDEDFPLKIIGGQHRFEAIKEALEAGVDEFHGVKVYFSLDNDQRLDVQLISNTNIAVSPDLLDRMWETLTGPDLRDWCQSVGLVAKGQDFADKRQRGAPVTVRAVRTFILNYFLGREIDPTEMDQFGTTPIFPKSNPSVPEWEKLKADRPDLWSDPKLFKAGKEFAQLAEAQRDHFDESAGSINVDYAEKAANYAVLSAWAFVAGMLHSNGPRLKRHYGLRSRGNTDPLNAAALAKGKHKSDTENYRGLGYRTDAKERGRFVELFFLQAESGNGIKKPIIDLAIKKYHAKQAILEVKKAEGKV